MNIKDFAEKFIKAEDEAWKKGDFSSLEKIEDPKIIIHMSPMPDMAGFEAHKQYIKNATNAVSNIKQEFQYLTGDGNLFALSYKSSGQIVKEMPGMPLPVGKTLSTNFLWAVRVNKGKVAEVWMNGSMMFN